MIARLKIASEMSLEHYNAPLLLTHSGGKDSCVLTELALRAEIPFEVMHAHTTADAPETVHFVRKEFARLENRSIRCSINYSLAELLSMQLLPYEILEIDDGIRPYCFLVERLGHVRCIRFKSDIARENKYEEPDNKAI